MKTAIIIGTTGLVGSSLLKQLLDSDQYSTVISVGRRMSGQKHEKLQELVTNLDNISDLELSVTPDIAFCCLGTTMKKAGSKEAFYKVDYKYVEAFANWAKQHDVKVFSVISAMGADPESFFYYNQVKGKIEENLSDIGFDALHIFRPSLLLGDREELRIGEDIGKLLNSILSPVIPKRYKGIKAFNVAKVMLLKSIEATLGTHIFPSDEIQNIASQLTENAK
ncbi:NAD-dependent epimerase/dehydratase family protein [Limibacter armeniacum]|uniref:NAD-dependent epimerase/dehydratase family protein n=1 Tax=Limibacter armeniacum TaxID=466084 RepID=UPI002FE5CEF5